MLTQCASVVFAFCIGLKQSTAGAESEMTVHHQERREGFWVQPYNRGGLGCRKHPIHHRIQAKSACTIIPGRPFAFAVGLSRLNSGLWPTRLRHR